MVSAHWEAAPVALSSTTGAPLLYDFWGFPQRYYEVTYACLLYTSDAADERSSVDLGGRRIIKKKNTTKNNTHTNTYHNIQHISKPINNKL